MIINRKNIIIVRHNIIIAVPYYKVFFVNMYIIYYTAYVCIVNKFY